MDEKLITLRDLMNNLGNFLMVFDIARIVNPVTKKVLFTKTKTEETFEPVGNCFDFWNQGKICDNCISMISYKTDKTFVKIEYNGEKIFLVTASSVMIDTGKVVVEFLKDITDTGIIQNIEGKSVTEVYKTINNLNEQLVKDLLTGVYNRRFIDERFKVDLDISSLNKIPISIIMADLDFFKRINDTYGHLVGDEVLKNFATLLRKNIREVKDWVARYGGDEFLICLKEANRENALRVAERMRNKVEKMVVVYEGNEIKVTASFGVVTIESEFCDDEVVIKKVDKNLYLAKENGRNKVVG